MRAFHERQGYAFDEPLGYHNETDAEPWISNIAEMLLGHSKRVQDAAVSFQEGGDARLYRLHLIMEEAGEIARALLEHDSNALLDGCADLSYVTVGTAVTFGLPHDEAFAAVHKSNMTKQLRSEEDPRLRFKGEEWVPADIPSLIRLHRRCRIIVDAERTDAYTDHMKPVKIVLEGCCHNGQRHLGIIKGGVTGYEAVYTSMNFWELCTDNGWWACAGTKGRWDKLFIPAKSMKEAYDVLV